MQQSPVLTPDCFGNIKSFSKKNLGFHYKAIVQIFYHKSAKVKPDRGGKFTHTQTSFENYVKVSTN